MVPDVCNSFIVGFLTQHRARRMPYLRYAYLWHFQHLSRSAEPILNDSAYTCLSYSTHSATFWKRWYRVGSLKASGFVSKILDVFLARWSIFFVATESKRDSFCCCVFDIDSICKRYSRDSCKIILKSIEICLGVSFLYLIKEIKFFILLYNISSIGFVVLLPSK